MHALKEIKNLDTLQIQAADCCREKEDSRRCGFITTLWKLADHENLPVTLHSNDTKMNGIIATPTYGTDREKDSKNVPNSR